MDDGERLAGSYTGAHRSLDHDAGRRVDRVLLLLAADAQLEPRQPHLQGVDRLHIAIAYSGYRKLDWRHGQAFLNLATLRGQHLEKLRAAGPGSQGEVSPDAGRARWPD